MPRWNLGHLDPEEERQRLDKARASAEGAWSRVTERERIEHEQELARLADERERRRVMVTPPAGEGCLLALLLWPLTLLWNMPHEGWSEEELRRLGGTDQTPETPEDVIRDHEEAMRKIQELRAATHKRRGCVTLPMVWPLTLLWRR